MANAVKDAPPEIALTATGDPVPPTVNPLILNNGYFQLSGTNLSCSVKHLEAAFPENKLVTVTTFCNEVDYPGITKWHLRATFYQDFSTGSVYSVLSAALAAYQSGGTPVSWQARPYAALVASATNPIISGLAIPQPFMQLGGDAGAASEVVIDWNLTAAPTVSTGAVTATGAVAGAPGYYTPSGATVPANLAALAGVTASPATNWAAGQYIVTADLLANNWNGSAWVAGKHP
jgi:hypothetical protein